MLVLAGPGTGKTTTLVEAIVDRIEQRGASPDEVLALTFSRKAAEQLRDRVTARLGRTSTTTLSSTFHSFAYGLVRSYTPAGVYDGPLRLLSAPEPDVVMRELLTDHPESVAWPESLSRRGRHPRLRPRGARGARPGPRERPRRPGAARARARPREPPSWWRPGSSCSSTSTTSTRRARSTTPTSSGARPRWPPSTATSCAPASPTSSSTSTRTPTPARSRCCRSSPATGATSPSSATRTSRSTASAGPRCAASSSSRRRSRAADGSPAEVVALRTTRRFGPRLLLAAQRIAGGIALPGTIPEAARADFAAPVAESGAHGDGRVEVLHLRHRAGRGRAPRRPAAPRPPRGRHRRGTTWRCWCAPAARPSPGCAARSAPPACPSRSRATTCRSCATRRPCRCSTPCGPSSTSTTTTPPTSTSSTRRGRRPCCSVRSPASTPASCAGWAGCCGPARRSRPRPRSAAPRRSRELVREVLVDPGFLDGLEGPEVDRARAFVSLLWRARAAQADGRHRRGGAVAALVRHAVARAAAARGRAGRRRRPACPPRPRRRSWPSSRRPPGPRSARTTSASPTSSPPWSPSRSPATPSPSAGSAAPRCACSPPTGPRAWSGGWSWSPTSSRTAGPTCAGAAPCSRPTGSAPTALVPPVSTRELLTEERRLFYVACTRARQRLVVTAVASADDEGEQPSRFLGELQIAAGAPQRSTAPAAVDGRPGQRPAPAPGRPRHAARRCARPPRDASRRWRWSPSAGRSLVPQADPATWWGTRAASLSAHPVRPADQPVPLSASTLSGLMTCPTQQFLSREAGGVTRSHQSANLGQIVHALAERVGTGEIEAGPDDADLLMEHVDAVWQRLEFRTPWAAAREHARVRSALARFLAWHHSNPRTLRGHGGQRSPPSSSSPTASRSGSAATSTGSRSTTTAGWSSSTSRPAAPSRPARPCSATPSSRSTSSRSTAGPSTRSCPTRPSGGAVPRPAGGARRQSRRPSSSARTRSPTTRPSARSCAPPCPSPPATCAREEFPAIPGPHCKDCPYVSLCPAKGAGSVVTQ